MLRILFAIFSLCASLAAQSGGSSFVGTITSINPSSSELEVKREAAPSSKVHVAETTTIQRVAPGEKDLKQAKTISLTDVSVGDRVLVTFAAGEPDPRRIVVMPALDIAKRNEADRRDWLARGVSGVVKAKDGNRITLKIRSMMTETEAVVTVTDRTTYRRYAPDSVRFADAQVSSIADIAPGDQLRARGEKSPDGKAVTAGEIVFGTFQTRAGSVSSVDAAARQVTIKELGTGKPLVIKIAPDSQMKSMPDFAAMMARGGGAPAGMPAIGAGVPPAGMPRPAGGFDPAQMFEHLPPAKLEDLKPGTTIVVSSTRGAKADEVTAIMFLANADMLIRMASMSGPAGGNRPAAMPSGGMGMGMGGMTNGAGGLDLPGMMP